ncbi:hypothetical protein BDZ89DRAFT_1057876 [Hymenopellis radicata]|nr:hypothetical protein BDZ89DRAFT_1057876 [Hymenopellis radicata]
MGRNNIGANHVLPTDPIFREINNSDGNSSTWPTNTTEQIFNVDGEPQVNWMQRLDLDSPGAIKWRCVLGKGLAAKYGWPGAHDKYVLEDWPEGYALFDHHKGKPESPRHDLYLYGHSKKFRSPAEFLPHAIWLTTPPAQRGDCECKYCRGIPQRDITSKMRESGIYTAPHAFSPRATLQRRAQPKKRTVIQDIAPKLKQSPNVAKSPMVVERSNDLRAMNAPSSSNMRRWHREQELVWAGLLKPIQGTESNQCIRFWPGVIRELKVAKKTINVPSSPPPSYAQSTSSSNGQNGTAESESAILNRREPPWSVEERQLYRIQLLGTTSTVILSEDHVLPYQAYLHPQSLLDALGDVSPAEIAIDDLTSNFDPLSDGATWEAAVSSYALAIQIAGSLSEFWTLTDDWEIKLAALTVATAPAPRPMTNSLTDAVNAASSHNALANESISSGPLQQRPDDRPAKRIPGEYVTSVMHFQGIWWGAERIWADELIRLKAPRRCLAPEGSDQILAPALPGPREMAHCIARGANPSDFGASARGLFLLVKRIFVTEVESRGRMKKECRLAGLLYELADDDWIVPETELAPPPDGREAPADTRGKFHDALSHPTPVNPLPSPPAGYQFRAIISPEHEFVTSLSMISGRYYPQVLQHPLLKKQVEEILSGNMETSHEANVLWSLEGLSSGMYNSVEPRKYLPSRGEVLEQADKEARGLLHSHLEKLRDSLPPYVDDAMDVDG